MNWPCDRSIRLPLPPLRSCFKLWNWFIYYRDFAVRIFKISLLFFLLSIPTSTMAQFVIVAPQDSPVDSLTHDQLYKLFRGQAISGNLQQPLQIVEYEPETDAFYDHLYGMNAFAIGKHWLRKIFAGDKVLPPKNFSDRDKFVEYVRKNKRAIGFLSKKTFRRIRHGALKSIAIDNKSYDQPGYSLKGH